MVATFQVSTVKTVPESLRVPLGEISRQLVCAALDAETKAPGLGAVEEWVMYHMFVKSVLDSATEAPTKTMSTTRPQLCPSRIEN